MIEIKTMWFPSDTEKNGTRTEFPSGMDFGAGLEVSDIKFSGFFFPLSFSCYALNFITAREPAECCLTSNSLPLSVRGCVGPRVEFSKPHTQAPGV